MAYKVFIHGNNVLDNTLRRVSIASLSRDYDNPAELTLRVHGEWRESPWACDTPVIVRRDVDVIFEGILNLPEPIKSTGEFPGVLVTAQDRSHALRYATALNDDGWPHIELPPGPLAAVLEKFVALERVAAELQRVGVYDGFEFVGGAEAITCLPVTLTHEKIDTAFRKIAAAAPGVRCFLKPAQQVSDPPRYCFVSLYGAPTYDLQIDVQYVPQLTIKPSIEDRFGAVRVLGGRTTGTAEVEGIEDVPLIPAWNTELEQDWSSKEALLLKDDGTLVNPDLANVYRLFTWDRDDIVSEMIDSVLVQWSKTEWVGGSAWVRRGVQSIDLEAKTLLLKTPATAMRLPRNEFQYRILYHKSRALKMEAKMRVRTSGTAATPIYIAEHRVPAAGFAGRAYEISRLRCGTDAILEAPPGVSRENFARDAFNALSEPKVSGQVPIDGDLPEELFLLGRRINITTAGFGDTTLEDLAAPLMGVTVSWNPAVQSEIAFDRDETALLSEGAS